MNVLITLCELTAWLLVAYLAMVTFADWLLGGRPGR